MQGASEKIRRKQSLRNPRHLEWSGQESECLRRIPSDYWIRAIWIKKEEDGRILSTILSLPTLPEKLTEMCRPDSRRRNKTR